MKFKQFNDWCNQRACDGCWSMNTAMFCINLIGDINKKPFWKREKYWKEHCEDYVVTNVVIPINNKIKEVYGGQL